MNRHHLFIAFAAALALSLPACQKSSEPSADHSSKDSKDSKVEGFGRMSVDDVEAKLKEAQGGKTAFFVFDNNAKSTFDKGHVPGAKWVDHEKIQATDLPADKASTLVFYCASEECMACHEGAEAAMKLGYQKVFIMPAGISGWKKAGKTVEPTS